MKTLLLALLVVTAAVGVYYLYPKLQTQVEAPTPGVPAKPVAAAIPGWQTCNYPSFGFAFQYPPNWNIYVYSAHAGAGNVPIKENCGDWDRQELNPEVTVAPSPSWNSAAAGGMQITATGPVLPQFMGSSTLGGQPSYVKADGSIFAGGYKIVFGERTPSTTRESIISTFQFISQ